MDNMEHTAPNPLIAGMKRRYKIVIPILIVGFALATLAAVFVHTKYVATANMVSTGLDSGSSENSSNSNGNNTVKSPITLADLPVFAQSETVVAHVVRDLHGKVTASQVHGGLRTSTTQNSSILRVQFTSKSPATSVKLANTIAHEIALYVQQASAERYDMQIKDLSTQLEAMREKLASLDATLDADAKRYPFVDVKSGLGGDGQSVYDRLTQLRSQHDDALAAVASDESNLRASAKLVENSKPVAEQDLTQNDAAFKSLSDQYAKDNEELQHIQSFGNYDYPGLKELQETVANEAKAVAARRDEVTKTSLTGNPAYADASNSITRIEAQLASDRARLNSIDASRAQLESELGSDSIASDVDRVRRDRDDTDSAYRTLATNLTQAQADRAQAVAMGLLVELDPASGAEAVTLSSGIAMALAIVFLTLWLAITVALFGQKNRVVQTSNGHVSFDGHVTNLTHDDLTTVIER